MQSIVRDVSKDVRISVAHATLEGDLFIPRDASYLVIFAHGSGGGRFNPRERFLAEALQRAGAATLVIDLLTPAEEALDRHSGELRFDIELLATRIVAAIDWAKTNRDTEDLPIGIFGASTAAAAALAAAARRPEHARAIVCRGVRPDLAGHSLPLVRCPVLLIAAGDDPAVMEMNRAAYDLLACRKKLEIVAGASHLFEETGALENVATLAAEWFRSTLPTSSSDALPVTHVATTKKVVDVMTSEPVYVRADVLLPQVARLMRDWDCGEIPVCSDRKVVGVITDRDITCRAVAQSLNPFFVVASEVMTVPATTIREDATVDRAVDLMRSKKIGRLPVVNERGELVGIVSQSDLLGELPARRAAELSRELAQRPRRIARRQRAK